jgi:hypothetical protein
MMPLIERFTMTEQRTQRQEYTDTREDQTSDIEDITLSVVSEGGNAHEVIEALGAIRVTQEAAISTVHRLIDSGKLALNPDYTLSLTPMGLERLGEIEPDALTRALGETTVQRRQLMEQLGRAITERTKQ